TKAPTPRPAAVKPGPQAHRNPASSAPAEGVSARWCCRRSCSRAPYRAWITTITDCCAASRTGSACRIWVTPGSRGCAYSDRIFSTATSTHRGTRRESNRLFHRRCPDLRDRVAGGGPVRRGDRQTRAHHGPDPQRIEAFRLARAEARRHVVHGLAAGPRGDRTRSRLRAAACTEHPHARAPALLGRACDPARSGWLRDPMG